MTMETLLWFTSSKPEGKMRAYLPTAGRGRVNKYVFKTVSEKICFIENTAGGGEKNFCIINGDT
jgi:hypothetical protein